MVQADWFVMLREGRSLTASSHYTSREEAERIARQAHTIGAVVIEGPRALERRELLAPMDRAKAAA